MELADLFSKKALGDFLNKLFDALFKMAAERMKVHTEIFMISLENIVSSN